MENKIPSNLIDPLNAFLTSVNAGIEAYDAKMNFDRSEVVAVANIGKRYAKLALQRVEDNGELKAHSVYCFLDLTDGSIWKGSWKAPVANGKRGNLNDADILEKVTPYGTAYLRGGATASISAYLKEALISA
jgi:hypothetical protein